MKLREAEVVRPFVMLSRPVLLRWDRALLTTKGNRRSEMARKAKLALRIKAIRAMFKPLRDARLKRERRLAEAYARFQADMQDQGDAV